MFSSVKKISSKLVWSFVIVAVVSSISGIAGAFLLQRTDAEYSHALVYNGFSQGEIGRFNSEFNKGSALVRDIIMASSQADIKTAQDSLASVSVKADTAFTAIKLYCTTPKELELIDTITKNVSLYREQRDRVISLRMQNKADEALAVFRSDAMPLLTEIETAADAMTALNSEIGTEVSNNLTQSSYVTIIVICVLIVIGFVISIILALAIARSISRPINVVKEAAIRLEQGDLDIDIKTDLQDEVGVMSRAFSAAAVQMRAYIADVNHGLTELGKGNFLVEPGVEYKGYFKNIENAMKAIIQSLSRTLHQINNAADQVAAGSGQVSDGAQALSQGATEQASAVEELSATISEISGQIKSTAENAAVATSKVNEVGVQLNGSNAQMQSLISAMSDISSGSKEIGKIIKTIEDIAFQTNILALNAAVEAARAGAAGKGFAVVADEVRNLASKSAEAAKNTTALIENSMKSVENGTRIAGDTANSLLSVVQGADDISTRVAQISDASNEQANSIAQVTMGVDQISSVVQTNSATSEQSAAASEELSSQAQMLKGLVSQFRLPTDDSDSAPAHLAASREPHKEKRSAVSSSSKY